MSCVLMWKNVLRIEMKGIKGADLESGQICERKGDFSFKEIFNYFIKKLTEPGYSKNCAKGRKL